MAQVFATVSLLLALNETGVVRFKWVNFRLRNIGILERLATNLDADSLCVRIQKFEMCMKDRIFQSIRF